MRRQPNEARINPVQRPFRDLLLAAVLGAAAGPASGLGLGEIRVQSFIGEPLAATVTLIASDEEEFTADCFSAAPPPGEGVPALGSVRITLERTASRAALKVQTSSPITEPMLRFRLLSSCTSGGGLSRDYLLAFDPRPTIRPAVATVTPIAGGAPAATPAAAPSVAPRASPTRSDPPAPPLIPGFRPRPGDTLQSISAAIFPREEQARAAYLRALRARNPSVASLGDAEPLPTDVLLILPDLKALSRTLPAGSPAARPAEPRKAAAPTKAVAPVEAAAAPATKAAPPTKAAIAPEPRPTAAREAVAPGDGVFRLRLSATELDTSRSRGIDERKRAEIRERRLLLEQDDQTAAMLGLRENLRQLENRFAALQRQVTTPGKGVVAEAPKAAPAAPAAPASPGTAPIAPTDPTTPAVPARATDPASTGASSPPPEVATPSPAPAPKATPVAAPQPKKPPSAEPAVDWPWLLVGLALALAAGVMTWWKRRSEGGSLAPVGGEAPASWSPAPRTKAAAKAPPATAGGSAPHPAPGAAARTEPRLDAQRSEPERPRQAPAKPAPRRPSAAPVEEAQDSAQLRQRYRQARFPEIVNGVVTLSDPASVVRGARTLYEDGALPRALELLELAIADDPKPLGPWLALLEIHRQEGLAADFGALAARFQWQHGDAAEWLKVQSVGREFDPDNPLFAASGKVEAFNPLTDNWLDVPSDFSPDGLAAELHAAAVAIAPGRRAA